LEKKEVMVETATRTDASINFIWIESRRYGHQGVMALKNETPVKVIIK
jgi:hypothetical protein